MKFKKGDVVQLAEAATIDEKYYGDRGIISRIHVVGNESTYSIVWLDGEKDDGQYCEDELEPVNEDPIS